MADHSVSKPPLWCYLEMGRTAQLNGTNGKDHWPLTSAMIVGPATQGGRVFGGFDAGYQGLSLDLSTAEPDDRAPVCSVESVGAALLELGVLMPPSMFPMQTHFERISAVRVLCWGMLWSVVAGCETADKSEDSGLCTVLSYAFGRASMLEHCQGCHSSLLPIPHRAGAPQSVFFDKEVRCSRPLRQHLAAVETEQMPPRGGIEEAELSRALEWLYCMNAEAE